jgi:hypothetical protein
LELLGWPAPGESNASSASDPSRTFRSDRGRGASSSASSGKSSSKIDGVRVPAVEAGGLAPSPGASSAEERAPVDVPEGAAPEEEAFEDGVLDDAVLGRAAGDGWGVLGGLGASSSSHWSSLAACVGPPGTLTGCPQPGHFKRLPAAWLLALSRRAHLGHWNSSVLSRALDKPRHLA